MAHIGTESARWVLFVGAIGLGAAGCSGDDPVTPTPSDGGARADGSVADAARSDAGPLYDAGPGTDAGPMHDAGPMFDAGPRSDAGQPSDAGSDAGPIDAGPPPVCGAATPRFAGALCGPGATPCALQRDERVESGHFRNDSPAIALDSANAPKILYSIAEGGYTGMYATRTAAGAWIAGATGFELATGGLVFDGDTAIALAYDGAFHTDAHTLVAGAWTRGERLPSDQVVSALNVLRDEGGCVHALGDPSTGMASGGTTYLVRDATWHTTAVGGGFQVRPVALALAPSGEPHVAWSEIPASGSTYELRATRGPSGSELVWMGGMYDGTGLGVRLGVSAAAGYETPHLLFVTPGASGASEIRHASRASDGAWTVEIIEAGRPRGCDEMTPTMGATCTVDGVSFVPVAVIVSGSGDVRLFYVNLHETGTLTGVCGPGGGGPGGPGGGGPPPPFECHWDGPITRDARLMVATPGVTLAEVSAGMDLATATAALDASGNIHIAAYDLTTSGAGVRYLMIAESL